MKRYISVVIVFLLSMSLISSNVLAAEMNIMDDTEFEDNVYESSNMEIIKYDKPVKNKFGTFAHQFSPTGENASVTYKIPDGAVMIGFEIILVRPTDDSAGWDTFTVKCGNGAFEEQIIGSSESTTAFIVDYDKVGGQVWDLFTTDATGETLRENGYNTLKIELDTVAVEKKPIGIQQAVIYYIMASFEGFSIDGMISNDKSTVSGSIQNIELNFNTKISSIDNSDLTLEKNGEVIPAIVEQNGTNILIRPEEGFKYNKEYKLSFGEAFLNFDNFPKEFSVATSPSDFVSSDENINDNGTVCSASVNITNYTKENKKAIACLVSYKDSQILDKNYTVVENLAPGNKTAVNLGQINSEDADEIMLMIWDNLLDMTPLVREIKK